LIVVEGNGNLGFAGSLIVTDMVEERAHRVDWLNDADVYVDV
jgi:hypothetical protein